MNAVELAQRYIDAWNHRDLAAFGGIFDPDVRYLDPIVGPEPIAMQAMGDYVKQLLTAFPDLRFEVGAVYGGDHHAVFEWVMHGNNTGASDAHPATGRSVALPGVDVIDIRGGRIVSIRAYFDRKHYLESLGLDTATADEALPATA